MIESRWITKTILKLYYGQLSVYEWIIVNFVYHILSKIAPIIFITFWQWRMWIHINLNCYAAIRWACVLYLGLKYEAPKVKGFCLMHPLHRSEYLGWHWAHCRFLILLSKSNWAELNCNESKRKLHNICLLGLADRILKC